MLGVLVKLAAIGANLSVATLYGTHYFERGNVTEGGILVGCYVVFALAELRNHQPPRKSTRKATPADNAADKATKMPDTHNAS